MSVQGISMTAFLDELEKIGETRSSESSWSSKTVSAPRSKTVGIQAAKAPTAPGNLSSKLVGPASQFGKRQNYSQPNVSTTPSTNPMQGVRERHAPSPNVVFGVR